MDNAYIWKLQRKLLTQAMRNDFKVFLTGAFYKMHGSHMRWNWHHDVICDALVASIGGGSRRLIVNIPPRSLKSFICSVAFPAWVMGRNPCFKIIGVSYAQDLASKFSRQQRALMMSDWYKGVFPDARVNPKKAGEMEFELTKGGFRLATSTGGTLTGRGADLICVDDPLKPQDALSETIRKNANDWIANTLVTRLDDKQKGVIAMIMQRIHEEDPTGYLIEKGNWHHLSFPAIAIEDETYQLKDGRIFTRKEGELLHPEHEPLSVLNQLKSDMGGMHFNAQYQQQPIPVEGNLIKKEWIKRYRIRPYETKKYVLSVDTAMKDGTTNDWSVVTVWQMHENQFFLVTVIRKKMNFPELKACVVKYKHHYNAKWVLIEDKASGTALIQQLKAERIYSIGINPLGDKVSRFSSASAAFEQGQVFFPIEASWLHCLEQELLGFPGTKHDDQVDSVSQFLNWALDHNRRKVTSGTTTGYY